MSELRSPACIKVATEKEGGKGTYEHLFDKNQDVNNKINHTTKGCKLKKNISFYTFARNLGNEQQEREC